VVNLILEYPLDEAINVELLERVAEAVLKDHNRDVDVSVVITNNETIQRLNRDFLGTDAPTDVLSFLMEEVDPESGRLYIGDVIISYEMVKSQAERAGHDVVCELQLMVVHGILHLLGYDHGTDEEKQQMWAVQATLMRSLGCSDSILPD
jgi:probable rRNA maturation factor